MGIVAKAVAPPAADEVETAPTHGLKEVIAAIRSPRQLGGFFLGSLGVGCVV